MALDLGDRAPDFTLRDQHGRRVTLSASLGERAVLLVFFPFAFSGVCTGELTELRDNAARIADAGADLLAVSCDPMFALRAQSDRDGLEFPLLSDFWPHGEVAASYGVLDPDRGCPTRSSFLVDPGGALRWIRHNPMGEARPVDEAVAQITALSSSGA